MKRHARDNDMPAVAIDFGEDTDAPGAAPKQPVAKAEKPPPAGRAKMSFDEYLDAYYSLDYEDLIGDQPTRFKYRSVPANDYGLATEEILLADDSELNRWASLKRVTRYQTREQELRDRKRYRRRARDAALKRRILKSAIVADDADDHATTDGQPRARAHDRKR